MCGAKSNFLFWPLDNNTLSRIGDYYFGPGTVEYKHKYMYYNAHSVSYFLYYSIPVK